MSPSRALILSTFIFAAPATAQTPCEAFGALTGAAQVGASDMQGVVQMAAILAGAPPDTCQTARIHAAPDELICTWPFILGDTAAPALLEHLSTAITYCVLDVVRLPPDMAVNHPDFYKLHQFEMTGVAVAVSLKDKGALGQTFVRLRLSARE